MGVSFVSDEAIEKVKVCETRGGEVVATFGEPTARGRENDFTTLRGSRWSPRAPRRTPP